MNVISKIHNKEDISSHSSPKVSIIVATYRRKEALKRALQSLVEQTYPYIEIIVIDDNANAEWNTQVEKIVNSIKLNNGHEIIYIKNLSNKGSAETRNTGINQATGEFVTFLDDDDIYLPNKVKKQVEHMTKEGADFSLTDLWLYDEKGKLIEKRVRDYIKDSSSESLMKYHLMYHLTGTDVMMFKKKYLVDIGLFSPINVGDEFYLMQKAIDGKGIFSYLPGCEVKAYVHSETEGLSSGDGKIKGENQLYEYKKKYFDRLTQKEQNYIKMRHYAVLAFAEFRRKRYFYMIKNLCLSLIISPAKLISLFVNRK
ncbi:glycosyltransferase family 2 protein [Streptococcus parasuis]|uniref:glycosyltransferase family 2 protein n=1 Tax=Streptococcus parasuis TaxID=1501662 RepID=UPI0023784384|nr:glycosyltransferase family 2 protein [Streptococcus parasuis]WDN59827.1 glycosyltransferase [Streptococcus parasuis]